ncbi:hypothetical protein [Segeticoccus rhizosphaerae]|uniref:hypothetical protein n=1 Tax=Segeticoccus rhizosphaerae TaxID=1104777 RepID=UPI001264A1C4|nr:hypothetical protein [Segeticoccus rhizosphaerae]
MRLTVEIEEAAAEEGPRLLDEVTGWEDVKTDLPEGSEGGFITETLFAVALVIAAVSNGALTLARTVKYIQDNFHRAVLVDLTGDEPKVTGLPGGPGMRGRTWVKGRDGQVELEPNLQAPQLVDELKSLMPRSGS